MNLDRAFLICAYADGTLAVRARAAKKSRDAEAMPFASTHTEEQALQLLALYGKAAYSGQAYTLAGHPQWSGAIDSLWGIGLVFERTVIQRGWA